VSVTDVYKKALELVCASWSKTQGTQEYSKSVEEMTSYYLNKAKIELEKVK
jgi:hypothetical protein